MRHVSGASCMIGILTVKGEKGNILIRQILGVIGCNDLFATS